MQLAHGYFLSLRELSQGIVLGTFESLFLILYIFCSGGKLGFRLPVEVGLLYALKIFMIYRVKQYIPQYRHVRIIASPETCYSGCGIKGTYTHDEKSYAY